MMRLFGSALFTRPHFIAAGCVAGLVLLLGTDAVPWLKALRDDARTSLSDLVSRHRLELHRGEARLADAEAACARRDEADGRIERSARRIELDLGAARAEATRVERARQSLERRQLAAVPVRTASGRELTEREVALEAARLDGEHDLARTRLAQLEALRTQQVEVLKALPQRREERRHELERLRLSVDHLRGKVKLYEDILGSARELGADELDPRATLREAQAALERAHAEVDQRFETLFTSLGAGAGEGAVAAGKEEGPAEAEGRTLP